MMGAGVGVLAESSLGQVAGLVCDKPFYGVSICEAIGKPLVVVGGGVKTWMQDSGGNGGRGGGRGVGLLVLEEP